MQGRVERNIVSIPRLLTGVLMSAVQRLTRLSFRTARKGLEQLVFFLQLKVS